MSNMAEPIPSEPIAIVGSACRFAGGIASPADLWQKLSEPSDMTREVPKDRFNARAFYHSDGEHHGTTDSIRAYWLDQDHRVFDAAFFSITPKEAEAMDPQQKMLLEVVYEAMEAAGFTLSQYAGQNVGVFAGLMTADYDTLAQRDELTASQYYATGNARSIMSNRVSYFFDFRGPSMTIDTACSSSLVAMHQAILSLRSGESPMACVAGVNLMLTPEQFIAESSLHMLSRTGHCRMWDANADGYARGEGVAAVFLKPLSRALSDGDQIEAVIRETGVNSDGRTPGITMPNPTVQAQLIKETYRRAGLDICDYKDRCQYFEAHGTGTQVGDPLEASAIYEAFYGDVKGANRPAHEPKLLVGSVKTVIGHTEGAAGLAGVLKVVQAMKHGVVPPNLHLEELNSKIKRFIPFIEVPLSASPWPSVASHIPRRASVNSFGFGGTNAHAIIELYDPSIHNRVRTKSLDIDRSPTEAQPRIFRDICSSQPHLLPLFISAASSKSLIESVKLYKRFLIQNGNISCDQLAWQLFSRRTPLPYRVAISSRTREEMIEALTSLISKSSEHDAVIGTKANSTSATARILGIFTGQGAQWPTMSSSLLESNSVYGKTIRRLDQDLRHCRHPPTWTIEEQLQMTEENTRVHEAAVAQPLCTALQVALVDVLKSLGIRFHTVIGHSSGEIAAAYAAGRVSARDAILISYYRGMFAHLAVSDQKNPGGMVAAGISYDEALEFCKRLEFDGNLFIAADNAPASVTLSGDVNSVSLAKQTLTTEKKFARNLLVDTAYHSPYMKRPAAAYMKALKDCGISFLPPGNDEVRWISSVEGYGRNMSAAELSIEYWADNMVRSVRFRGALEVSLGDHVPFDCVVEVGPHPSLKGPVHQTIKKGAAASIPYSGLLDRSMDDRLAFSKFLGWMWSHNGPNAVNIRAFIEDSPTSHLLFAHPIPNLPSYPWDHSQIIYNESRISRQYHQRTDPPNELLGVRTRDDDEFQLRWRNVLKLDTIPWLEHHKFQGQALVPASAYCIMAFEASRALLAGRSASLIEIEDLDISSGVSVEPHSKGTETLFTLTVLPQGFVESPDKSIRASFILTSSPVKGNTTMKKNMSGHLKITLGAPSPDILPSPVPNKSETLPASTNAFYQTMATTELGYSGPFRSLKQIERRYEYASATLQRLHVEDSTTLAVSPATLDSCFQTAFLAYSAPGDGSLWTSFLPIFIKSVAFNVGLIDSNSAHPGNGKLHVETHITKIQLPQEKAKTRITSDITISNESKQVEIQVEGLIVSSIANTRPDEDYELYLHTVLNVDPEDEILTYDPDKEEGCHTQLIMDCMDIAQFSLRQQGLTIKDLDSTQLHTSCLWKPGFGMERFNMWNDSDESMKKFIETSPHSTMFQQLQAVARAQPLKLQKAPASVIQAMVQLESFKKHLGRIFRQISHRYARMKVCEYVDQDIGVTEEVVSALGSSFHSYTIVSSVSLVKSERMRLPRNSEHKIIFSSPDEKLEETETLGTTYDLVIISSSTSQSSFIHHHLDAARKFMKPGSFLVLFQYPDTSTFGSFESKIDSPMAIEVSEPVSSWPTLLEDKNLNSTARNCDQTYPGGFSIFVRQAATSSMVYSRDPFEAKQMATKHLLIIGGSRPTTEELVLSIKNKLTLSCGLITVKASFDELYSHSLSGYSAILVLADLDRPVVHEMTQETLKLLKELFRPEMSVLWVTHDSISGNPDHAATFGLARTIASEVPSLMLCVLDLEIVEGSAELVCEEFMKLSKGQPAAENQLDNFHHVREREIHYQEGHRMIPRVLPLKSANDRVNALRRVVYQESHIQRERIEVIVSPNNDGITQYCLKTHDVDKKQGVSDHTLIQVYRSSVQSIRVSAKSSAYLSVGLNVSTGDFVAAMSTSNSSYISVPTTSIQVLPRHLEDLDNLLGSIIAIMAAIQVSQNFRAAGLVLVQPDELFVRCLSKLVSPQLPHVVSLAKDSQYGRLLDSTCIQSHSTLRDIRKAFPPKTSAVLSFLPENSDLANKVRRSVPSKCSYHSVSIFTGAEGEGNGDQIALDATGFKMAVSTALEKDLGPLPNFTSTNTVVSLSELRDVNTPMPLFSIIDWTKQRSADCMVDHTAGTSLLNPNKTYLLVGMTRDLGQSVSTLFIEQGARNIVLASRNPNQHPRWIDEFKASYGVNIRIKKLDVCNQDEVKALKLKLSETMPPVGGVVNGAMVLDDKVFSQMTADVWNRVLRPKTVGSKNLDVCFSEPDMDFFIMTSSFAALGGHPGQSNYAAANMYMNGLAANRRRRGLPASVLNIGVIYGLGFLQREKGEFYAALEREGYPPISERDIHHMFIEAIVAGNPLSETPAELTTGLARFKPGDPDALAWQQDPRFMHFIVDHDFDSLTETSPEKKGLKDQIASLTSSTDKANTIFPFVADRLESQLMFQSGHVRKDHSMTELGVDSLVALEMRNWIWKTFQKDVAVMKLLDAHSIYQICLDIFE